MKSKYAKRQLEEVFAEATEKWEKGELVEASKLFQSAAELGHSGAQMNLGYFYDEVEGIEKNCEKALHWYKKAAQNSKKSFSAHINIGLLYKNQGKLDRARAWLEKAVIGGDGDAALELAKMLLSSRMRRSREQASYYLSLAMESNNITEGAKNEAEILRRQLP